MSEEVSEWPLVRERHVRGERVDRARENERHLYLLLHRRRFLRLPTILLRSFFLECLLRARRKMSPIGAAGRETLSVREKLEGSSLRQGKVGCVEERMGRDEIRFGRKER